MLKKIGTVLVLLLCALFFWLWMQEKSRGDDRKESKVMMQSDAAVNERKMTELPATEVPVTKAPSGGSDAARLLMLVNPWHKLPRNYTVDLTDLNGGHQIATLCYPALQQMMDDARAAGLHPLICSSFRTWQKQTRLYENKVAALMQKGYGREMAETAAAAEVAVPGTSEHQLGLALDIVDESNQNLDESQESTKVQKWLMENSWKYGFILRYPNEKRQITGIIYEPWHYRYVGKEAAAEIYANGWCLEEYLEHKAAKN